MKAISLTSLFPHGQNVLVRRISLIDAPTITVNVPAGRTHAWLTTFQILKTNQSNAHPKKGNRA
jgi:hypothetical protein